MAFPVLRSHFRSFGFPRSSLPGFPCIPSRFWYSALLYVSFRPSSLRSHSCSTSACLLLRFRFSSGIFRIQSRFLSSARPLLQATGPSVSSFPFFPFLPLSGFPGAASPLSLPCFPRSFLPDFSCILSRFPYLAFCWFPFVLPCFAPAAVPQVIPFWFYPPGPVPDFRFLSSASVLASHYSASVSSFPLSSRFRLTVASPVLCFRSRFHSFPRSSQPGFPCFLSRFFVLGFLFVSFHPSRFRSHSRSTGASLLFRFRFSSGLSPSLPVSFVPFCSGSDYSAFRSFFSLLPVLPCRRFLRCSTVSFVPVAFPFSPACFHAFLPVPVLSFLRFLSPLCCFVSQALRSFRPPVSSSAIPLCFRFRFWLLGLSVSNFSVRLRPRIYYHRNQQLSTPILYIFRLSNSLFVP